MSTKERAIFLCLLAREKAILIKNHYTKVGACIYTKEGYYFTGFNIQNRCHKSYHAEEMAILNCIINNFNPENIDFTYSIIFNMWRFNLEHSSTIK